MNDNKAKLIISGLLGVESLGAIFAVITAVYALCAWGADLSNFSPDQIWMVNNAVYILSGIILAFGVVLRPKRRALITQISQIPHFSNKLIYVEVLSAVAILITGVSQMVIPYLIILGVYSTWKGFEYGVDYWIFKVKGGFEID